MKNLLQKSLTIGIVVAAQLALSSAVNAESKRQSGSVRSAAQNNQNQEFTFDFTNTYDYASCLDVILLAYEQRTAELENAAKNDCANNVLNTFGNSLSKDTALKLVESADLHATEGLENPLYPTLGLRRRIAINLGYIYDADKSNPDILQYTSSESE